MLVTTNTGSCYFLSFDLVLNFHPSPPNFQKVGDRYLQQKEWCDVVLTGGQVGNAFHSRHSGQSPQIHGTKL